MSITNPSPSVLINGFVSTDGVDIDYNDTSTTFQLEDSAGVNVWVLECIYADEINTPFLDDINNNLVYVDGSNRLLNITQLRIDAPFTLPTGSALIFRSTVNNGVDINGNVREDFVTTVGVYILTNDTYGIPNNDLRVGAENETTEGDSQTGWTSKFNEICRLVGQPILASDTYPGIIQLAGDLGCGGPSCGLAPKVLKINGTSVEANPSTNDVLIAVSGAISTWALIDNDNIDPNADLDVSKLAPGTAGQILVNNSDPTPAWATMGGDASIDSTGVVTLQKLKGKTLGASLASVGATQDGYALIWVNSAAEWRASPAGGGSPSLVTWSGDLLGSTDVTQLVTHITGTTGVSENYVLLGVGAQNFAMQMENVLSGTGPAFRLQGTLSLSGNGGAVSIYGGGSTGALGGNLILGGGYATSDLSAGATKIVHMGTGSSDDILATFYSAGITLDATTATSTSFLDLNSGTDGTTLNSTGAIDMAGTLVSIVTNTAEISLNAKTHFSIAIDSATRASFTNTELTLGNAGVGQHLRFGDTTFGSLEEPLIDQILTSTHDGCELTIQAQSALGAGNDGGPLTLAGGTSGSGTPGPVNIYVGGIARLNVSSTGYILSHFAGFGSGYVAVDNSGVLSFSGTVIPGGTAGGDLNGTYPNPTVKSLTGVTGAINIATTGANLHWAAGTVTPTIDQADAGAGNGAQLSLVAQTSTAGSSTGGNLLLKSGAGTSANGALAFQTGSSQRGQFSGAGVFRVNNLSTGVVHADSSGDFTSTLIVDADVSGSAAIAYSKLALSNSIVNADVNTAAAIDVSKLASGTAGQLLLNNSTPTPTWTTMSGDTTISNSGVTTLIAIRGKATDTALASIGASEDGYVLTWANGDSEWQALPAPGSGSGVTWNDDLDGSSDLHQYVAEISGSGGGGGTVPLNITTLEFGASQVNPKIYQADETVNDASVMKLQAQNATASGKYGGNLFLQSGNGPSDAFDGVLILQTGATTRMTIANTGVVTIANLSTGVVHADSSGALTSSTVAASEITPGTAGQILVNNSTPLPAWVTMSGDTTISNAGATTLVAIRGKATDTDLASVGATQDGYVLTWVNGDSEWQAKPSAGGAGSGVTTVGTIDTSPSANGLTISGTTIYTQYASASNVGMVSTGTQTMAGAKTFSSAIVAGSTTGVNTFTGGQIWTTRTLAADLTINTTTTDMIILCSTAAARNITLPAPVNGRIYIIKDSTGQAETNNITLIRNGSEKIEGVAASRILSTNWGVWRITTDGTDWFFL